MQSGKVFEKYTELYDVMIEADENKKLDYVIENNEQLYDVT